MLVLRIEQLCPECSWTEICQRCHPPQNTCFQSRICRLPASSPTPTIATSPDDSSSHYSPSAPAPPDLRALVREHEANSKRDGDPPEYAMAKKAAIDLELAGRRDGHTFGDLRSAAKATGRLREAKAWCITSFQRKTKKLEHQFGVNFRRGRMSKWGAQA
ncbi:hypothetical protein B0A48_09367 [Cryoendolithus antarcticus]|uniref:Uncharacterized protein n=1 Tax=Cryoendolithus antarcticus TaxID=1507870 RepID=A0A1V8SZ55_9PEZI|nr:hypothetical protein B0A48_09367 [Cryoendolithus antarcticus]